MPDGSFSFHPIEKTGDWTILALTPTQDNIFKLTGSIRLLGEPAELPSSIVAIVTNAKICNHSFTGAIVEKVSCSLGQSMKDDASVFKGVK